MQEDSCTWLKKLILPTAAAGPTAIRQKTKMQQSAAACWRNEQHEFQNPSLTCPSRGTAADKGELFAAGSCLQHTANERAAWVAGDYGHHLFQAGHANIDELAKYSRALEQQARCEVTQTAQLVKHADMQEIVIIIKTCDPACIIKH